MTPGDAKTSLISEAVSDRVHLYSNLIPSQPQSIRPSSKDSCLSVFKAGGGDRAERGEEEMQTHR